MKVKIAAGMACALFLFHCISIGLSLLPPNPATPSYSNWIQPYVNPVFRQNWRLFAPEPAISSLHLRYRCGSQKDQLSDWTDPISPLIKHHKRTFFTYSGKQVYVYKSIARLLLNHALAAEKVKKTPFMSYIQKTSEYQLAKKFIQSLCQKQNPKYRFADFEVSRQFTKNFSKRAQTLTPFKKKFHFSQFGWSI